jgi:hypothetical protein
MGYFASFGSEKIADIVNPLCLGFLACPKQVRCNPCANRFFCHNGSSAVKLGKIGNRFGSLGKPACHFGRVFPFVHHIFWFVH